MPNEAISDKTSPSNMPGWGSLSVINLVLAMEDEFDVKFTTEEIVSMCSVRLVEILRPKGVVDV